MKCGTMTLKTPNGFKFELDYYWKTQLKEDNDPRQWPIALIFPGSGFVQMTEREGEPIALALSAQGYQVAVVQYNLLDQGAIYPNAIDVGLTAIRYVQKQAEVIHGDTDKIITIGFSAGAHVVALMNGCGQDTAYLKDHGFKAKTIVAAAQVLGYPVIDLVMGFPSSITEAEQISPDHRFWGAQHWVSTKTAPTFIWNTAEDAVVPPDNSLTYALALARKKVPYEIHTFTKGKHGLCLSTVETSRYNYPEDIEPRAAVWFEMMLTWIQEKFDLNHVDFN